MDKYQVALNNIIKSCCSYCNDNNGCQNCKIKQRCNATAKKWVDTLQELIDKETPMKPIKEIIDDSYDDNDRSIDFQWERIKCPNCKEDLVSEPEFRDFVDYPYCPLCSQKLDWSDNDE